jgi:hypothetical protein
MKKVLSIFVLCLFICGCQGFRCLKVTKALTPNGKVYEANHIELNFANLNAGLEANEVSIVLEGLLKIEAKSFKETTDPNSAIAEAELVTAIGDVIIPCLLKNNVIAENDVNMVEKYLIEAVEQNK